MQINSFIISIMLINIAFLLIGLKLYIDTLTINIIHIKYFQKYIYLIYKYLYIKNFVSF
jgi:hypothetical protein